MLMLTPHGLDRKISDKHAPIREHRVKDRCNPWITKEIIMYLMYQRDCVHKQAAKYNSENLMKEYRVLRNKVTSEIKKAQTSYYKSKTEENNGNNKCVAMYVAYS